MALGVIAAGGAAIGAWLGSGVVLGATAHGMIAAGIVALAARVGWRSLRRGNVRERSRSHLRTLLGRYGGGAYGTVALAAFVYLEGRGFVSAWSSAPGVVDFIYQQSLQTLFGFSVAGIMNGVHASLWPLYVLKHFGAPVAGMMLAGVWAVDGAVRRLRPLAAAFAVPRPEASDAALPAT